ncbi:mannose-1-phosphate guanylyltransferase/mannose-6-phosphate isomerase [Oxalicibacterium solurbis]|uniref:mannose-1-phosphate guanylyltransferase n=1 Tax=Oxalicibacterium solurbis TaxID=69280 RepID=A0A8J3F6B6_9BURK|nr:mannose-1-phosphate guanylyltransferase/mannose-6-phosphate isomerase [Oxalicibacterium solurbis]GGI54421.1 phosphomannose isomerase/mannose-1-phosphate guanylyl transferase [Oxalicibacterium solurbis]
MLIPIILSGGAGTRLWPVSREAHPKPFMCIGQEGKTLLYQTYERAVSVTRKAPLIVTNRDYYFLSRDELAGQPLKPRYLLEPTGRNTAPAIALAALWALEQGSDPCMLVMPADHLITKHDAFAEAISHAATFAEQGGLILFGISPSGPETGFGYIEMAGKIAPHANAVRRFVEKPDLATAIDYIAQGNYVWNSGMFCFKASSIIDAFAQHAPQLLEAARTIWKASEENGDRIDLPADFAELENISIDYAVMEKTANIAVVSGDFGWSDIGSWSAVAQAIPADPMGNTATGQSIVIDSRNTHIESQDRLVAAIGLDNLLIIDTPDALLVADKTKSQDVRKIVSHLKATDNDAYKVHRTVARPWGTYTVLEEGTGFKIKRIVVKPGQSLSLQMHHRRSEHWVVVSGTANVTIDHDTTLVSPNQSTYIPIGAKHRLNNPESTDLIMIEVQCGSYLGEDDIVRFNDDYGRV